MPFVPRACDKCGGDLYWEEDMYEGRWHCLQCGADQQAIAEVKVTTNSDDVEDETLEIRPAPKALRAKRPYRKGEGFYKRYPKLGPETMKDTEKSSEYWEGYRQAVLDCHPK